MNQTLRNSILLGLFAVFLVVGSYLIVTAQGLVFDFENFRITKTGGIYLKFSPTDADLQLNGKSYPSERGLLNNAVFIKKLLPGKYELKISKDGFFPWEKEVVVRGSFVASATKIKLWPKVFASTTVEDRIQDFWITNKGPIYKDYNGNLYFKNQLLRGESVILSDASANFIVTADKQVFFLIDLQNPKASTNLNELFHSLKQQQLGLPGNVPIENFFIHPFNQGKIIFATKSSLYSLDFKKITLERLYTAKSIRAGITNNNEVLFTDDQGNFIVYNLVLKNSDVLSLNLPPIQKIKSNPSGNKILILDSDNNLLFYNRTQRKLETISDSVRDFYISPDEKRIAVITLNGEIRIFYIADYEGDEKYAKNSFFKLPFLIETPLEFYWFQNQPGYSMVFAGSDLIISELDSRPPLNYYKVFEDVKKYFVQKSELDILTKSGVHRKIDLAL